ncbi:MAG: hypothetical protein ACRCWW_06450 [Scandinavium sp.]|uniref:hypothetical protein n=1 Tax=Scandinavium sp. TaxID=2830653 RepID=UPI003F39E88D
MEIRNHDDYESSLERIDALYQLNPKAGTPEHTEMEALAAALLCYENRHFPIVGDFMLN